MIKWGLVGASIMTWVLAFEQFLNFARRGSARSEHLTVEMSNHGRIFFISQNEAWGLALLMALAFGFFMIGWFLHHRPSLRPVWRR